MAINDTPPTGALLLAEASIDQDEGFPHDAATGLAHPYWDNLGKVWTIGTGLTRLNGVAVTAHTAPITRAQNDAAVGVELEATRKLLAAIVHVPLAACEWAALANWTYNVGGGAATGSLLVKYLNAGDRARAVAQFSIWDVVKGIVSPGLLARRKRTAALFNGLDVPGVTDAPGAPSAAARRQRPDGSPDPSPAPPAPRPPPAPPASSADVLMQAELASLAA